MPTQLLIQDGPPFKSFFFKSVPVDRTAWILTFTFVEWKPGGLREALSEDFSKISIVSIGVPVFDRQAPTGPCDEDAYTFIGIRHGSGAEKFALFYYVGTYNTRTRKGQCLCLTAEEFAALPNLGLILVGKVPVV